MKFKIFSNPMTKPRNMLGEGMAMSLTYSEIWHIAVGVVFQYNMSIKETLLRDGDTWLVIKN
jgi:hypothetical protein